jgi:hypothetical protein
MVRLSQLILDDDLRVGIDLSAEDIDRKVTHSLFAFGELDLQAKGFIEKGQIICEPRREIPSFVYPDFLRITRR